MIALAGGSVCSISSCGPLDEYGPTEGLGVGVGVALAPSEDQARPLAEAGPNVGVRTDRLVLVPAAPVEEAGRPATPAMVTAATTVATTAAAAAAGIRKAVGQRRRSTPARRLRPDRRLAARRSQASGSVEKSSARARSADRTRSSSVFMPRPPGPRPRARGPARPAPGSRAI